MTYENKFTDYTGHKLKADVRNFRPDIDTDKKLKMYRDHISNTEARIAQPGYAGVSDGGLPLWRAMLWDTEEAQRIKENDSEFWDEVDERTPPPEDRNAGDILEIIDAVNEIQDKETPSEFNVNSNSVTSDQTADWKTSINNSGKRAQINADVINDNYIVNRNAFNPDDPIGKAANNFNFNTSDATQDLQWETDITNTGDDAVINAGVYNSLGNFNDNRYGESFSQASDQDSEDVFRYISSNSNEFNPEYTEYTEGNGTNDVSFIRDRNDIGTKFLNQFRSNLFA